MLKKPSQQIRLKSLIFLTKQQNKSMMIQNIKGYLSETGQLDAKDGLSFFLSLIQIRLTVAEKRQALPLSYFSGLGYGDKL